MGYGIGSGIVVNRQPFYGWEGYTGEIGHIVIDSHSKWKGREGIYGTLEAVASGYGIADIVKEKIRMGEATTLTSQVASSINAKSVIMAAIEGDKLAIDIIDSAADYVGISIDILIKLFNPQAISLSGGMLRNDYLIERIKKKVESVSLPPYKGKASILTFQFWRRSCTYGRRLADLAEYFEA